MRTLILLPLVLALCMIMTGCEKQDELLRSSLLKTRWIESYEEKTAEEIEIYRPGDHEYFPPSWYRQVFYFDDNKVCEYSVLAATDAHVMARGSWEYNEKTKILRIYNSDAANIYEFKIVELSRQMLKLTASN